MSETIVIVGAGQAGGHLAGSLRTGGFDGRVVVVGDEPHPPYQRPPLSKQFLAGTMDINRVYLRPTAFYDKARIELMLNCHVEIVDRSARTVVLADGTVVPYTGLALATGSRVRMLSLPGADLDGIHYLRNITDMQALQARLQPGARLVVVGGGYIGLEVASVAIQQGLDVTVLEMASRLMQRVAGSEIAEFYSGIHAEAGVKLCPGVQVSGFEGTGAVNAVRCEDGTCHPADVVLVGVGIVPQTQLAEAAGLAVDNGITVDAHCRTSDPAIVAAGDCANRPNAHLGHRLRLESVPNALASARDAALTLCGKPQPSKDVPWFWSDQYDLKLQIAGLRDGHDEVVMRGEPAARKFMVCYLRGGELIAVESVNNPREFMTCRDLIAGRAQFDPHQLADSAVPLQS